MLLKQAEAWMKLEFSAIALFPVTPKEIAQCQRGVKRLGPGAACGMQVKENFPCLV
jgi:hypothetical protein